jgi:succinoglycan biosynthesis protein ExoV
MPHHDSAQWGDWRGLCEALDLHYIDPTASTETVLADIQSTEVLIAEAMHGAIVADALRVPWVAVRAYASMLSSKWVDWCQSLRLEYRPNRLSAVWDPRFDTGVFRRLKNGLRRRLAGPLLRRVARHGRPQLSAEPVFRTAYERLCERLEQFRADCRAGVFLATSRT